MAWLPVDDQDVMNMTFVRRLALTVLLALLVPAAAAGEEPLVPRALARKAATEGVARVIVRLATGATWPEGWIDGATVAVQRQRIQSFQQTLRGRLAGVSHRVVREFRTAPYLAIEASPAALAALEALRGTIVERVVEDTLNWPTLDVSGPLVEAGQAWNLGLDGSGTVIAVVDTGVDASHPFLAGKVIAEACFSSAGNCPGSVTSRIGPAAAIPCTFSGQCRHGTHVAGIAAGNGVTGHVGFSGVAPGASLIAIQVASRLTGADCEVGVTSCVGIYTSDVVAALEHVYGLRGVHPIAAVNLSLGGAPSILPCDDDPRKPFIDNLRAAGIATVAASGNDGVVNGISAPACISTAISVGASSKTDLVAPFSNVASFLSLFAPGLSILSSVPGGGFEYMNGTSMATPHVAGAWALLKQASPGASVGQVLAALSQTGVSLTDFLGDGVTVPRIRIAAALGVEPVAAVPLPTVGLAVNRTAFRPGESITLDLSLANPGPERTVDIYVAATLPAAAGPDLGCPGGDAVAFLTEQFAGVTFACASSPAAFVPLARVVPLGSPAAPLPVTSFSGVWPDGIPDGDYVFFAALTRPGAFHGGAFDPADLVALTQVTVTLSR
jgi:hypothetical protein